MARQVRQVRPVRHEPAGFDKFAVIIDRCEAALSGKCSEPFSIIDDHGVSEREESVRVLFRCDSKGYFEIAR